MLINLVLTSVVNGVMGAEAQGTEAKLLEDLFRGHDRDARPVKEASRPVLVHVTFALAHMEGLVY